MLHVYRLGYFVLKYGTIGILLVVFYANTVITAQARPHLYTDIDRLPYNEVGLLLGTSKYGPGGRVNLFFEYRIRAALDLLQAGKIDYLIASGDNSHSSYNEPVRMKEELIARGVDAERIYLDYAGFRTLDSVVRTHRVFGRREFTIISQGFHAERALYLAENQGLDTVAYSARDVEGPAGVSTSLREYFARVKALLDVHVLGAQPKFLGDPIEIGPREEKSDAGAGSESGEGADSGEGAGSGG
ncbi:MAG: vancomycin high temperature exclusion protein [Spirochaetes bacterium]|jgi:SanA protein|nr:vancomycin high temperature exclusion protein [Spirochaetota bacterium]